MPAWGLKIKHETQKEVKALELEEADNKRSSEFEYKI